MLHTHGIATWNALTIEASSTGPAPLHAHPTSAKLRRLPSMSYAAAHIAQERVRHGWPVDGGTVVTGAKL